MPLPTSPTILLAAAGLVLVLGWYLKLRTRAVWETVFCAAWLLAAGILFSESMTVNQNTGQTPFRIWNHDALAVSEEWVVLGFGLLSGIALCGSVRRREQRASIWSTTAQSSPSTFDQVCDQSHVYGFLLAALAGLSFVATCNDFLSLGLALEIITLATTGLKRSFGQSRNQPKLSIQTDDKEAASEDSSEWHAWLAWAFVWIGIGLLTNALATTNFDGLRSVLIDAYDPVGDQAAIGSPSKLILLAAGMIVLGLFARMGLVPFHFGFAECLPGMPIQCMGILIQIPQLASAIALTRLCGCVFVGLGLSLTVLMMVLSLSTFLITVVTTATSISTQSVPRWLKSLCCLQNAWLGIGLITVAIELDHRDSRWGAFPGQIESLGVVVLAQLSGCLACGGCYWVIGHLARSDRSVEFIEDLKGLARYSPIVACALLLSLTSWVGCPWTLGFWSRWLLLLAGHNIHMKSTSSVFLPHSGIRIVMFVATISTLLIVGIVIRLVREIVWELPFARPVAAGGRGPLAAGVMAAVAMIILGVAPQLALNPLRSIEPPRPAKRQVPERGSGSNHSAYRTEYEESVEKFE